MLSTTDHLESTASANTSAAMEPLRVGFVMHVMQVAGAEMLVAAIIEQLGERLRPTIFCLDDVGQLGHQLKLKGVEVVCLNRTPGLDRRLAFRFAREIRERDIDVLHAHQYTPFFYSALARAVGSRKTRIILTEHGRHWPDVVSTKRRWCNHLFLARYADRINACCQFSATALATIDGFPADRIDVIYNGVDTDQFDESPNRAAARDRLGLDANRRYVAMIARFHPVKDHESLLRAFQIVCQSRDDTDLLLVGDGELRSQLETLAKDLRIDDRVQFWGVRNDVATILQAIDVFALSSVSEAASLTLLEAMACACPVVVTEVGGNPEIVEDHKTGLLAPRRNPQVFGQALLEMLADPVQAKSYGDSARQRVLEKFRLEQAVASYEQLYADLAGVC